MERVPDEEGNYQKFQEAFDRTKAATTSNYEIAIEDFAERMGRGKCCCPFLLRGFKQRTGGVDWKLIFYSSAEDAVFKALGVE